MSGAEALAVIGIIVNIIQIADFSVKVLNRAKEYGDKTKELPEAFADIATVLPLASVTFAKLRAQVEAQTFDEDSCKALRSTCERADDRLRQLKTILNHALAQKDASKPERLWKAVKSIHKEKEVKEIADGLNGIADHLTHFHVTNAPRPLTVADLETTLAKTALSRNTARPHKIRDYSHIALKPINSFVDRPGLQLQLESLFVGNATSETKEAFIVVVYGLGGAGKSQLVLDFARTHRSNYTATFWIETGQQSLIDRDFRQIYRILYDVWTASDDQLPKSEDRIAAVKNRLEQGDERWLLIYDDADWIMEESADFMDFQSLLPTVGNIDIIITSRDVRSMSLASSSAIEVSSMGEDEAIEMFLKYAKMKSGYDTQQVKDIVHELGYFPLAINLAGSYVKRARWSPTELHQYLPLYHQKRKDVLDQRPSKEIRSYGASILTTWETSFSAIQRRSFGASQLFLLLSYLNPEDVFKELFQEFPDNMEEMEENERNFWQEYQTTILQGESFDKYTFDDFFSCLEDYSLITWDATQKSFKIHKLVYAWVQDRLGIKDQQKFSFLALGLLHTFLNVIKSNLDSKEKSVPQNIQKSPALSQAFHDPHADEKVIWFDLKRRMVPHLILNFSALNKAFNDSHIDEKILWPMFNTSMFLGEMGRNVESMDIASFRRKHLLMLFGESDIRTVNAANDLAHTLRRLWQLEEAQAIQERNLEILQDKYGYGHCSTIPKIEFLASLLNERGKVQAAISMQREALRMTQTAYPLGSQSISHAKMNLSFYLQGAGEVEEAASLLDNVLLERRQIYGEDHEETISMNAARGVLYSRQGLLQEAYKKSRDVLDRRVRLVGDNDPSTLSAMGDLACALNNLGQHKEAEKYNVVVFEKSKEILGPLHPNTLTSMAYLAVTFSCQRRYESALKLNTDLVRLTKTVFGDRHPHYFLRQRGLSLALRNVGDVQASMALLDEALRNAKAVLGDDHKVISLILQAQGRA